MLTWLISISITLIGVYLLVCLIFLLIQEKLIFVGKRHPQDHHYRLASDYMEIALTTTQNGSIAGIHIPKDQAQAVVLYLHGNTGSLERWCYMAEELTTFGLEVYAIDYRGYGKSRGKRSEAVMRQDGKVWSEYIRQSHPDIPFLIYGRSLGTGFAIPVATETEVNALVLETPFDSLLDVAQRNFPFLPNRWLLRYPFRSDEKINQTDCPILIMHGTKDKVVPYPSALKLYNRVAHRSDAKMVTIQGAKHSNLNAFPLYREALSEFIAELQ